MPLPAAPTCNKIRKNSVSLNQCLEKCPNLIEKIPVILARFRTNRLGIVADIRCAFLQLSVAPEDRDYLRFLWETTDRTWEEGRIWDQEVDSEISARFMTWMEEVRLISKVKISRWLPGYTESKVNWTLYIFSDARLTSYDSAAADVNDFCYPIVLPNHEQPVVFRLGLDWHRDNLHVGVQMMTSILRQRYWIIGGRKTVRSVLSKCIRCKRHNRKRFESVPTPVPEARRKKIEEKPIVCLFTCAIYRAVHIELILSRSTDSSLQGLRRLVNRRGRPAIIFRNQGSNFTGFGNAYRLSHMKKWPPYFCDCESVINNRPITYLSQDSSKLAPLTSSLFLQEVEEIEVPDIDLIESTHLNRRLRYWQYLKSTLRERPKELSVGEIVLIGKDDSKRTDWPLARITEIIKGKHGHVRVVKLQRGNYPRPSKECTHWNLN
ncbi:hypothetical protein ILUMI_02935 [Ignelater luminosus]|uniref:Integrase zinc-binding domain-containing protein n=1 Tax=Ignelater luminosus TaxID=2038154 RepID=A0A8K0DFK2_IGNLU|nr:hypothetical protein ILUMI_02935 [Ignelater luminosus]